MIIHVAKEGFKAIAELVPVKTSYGAGHFPKWLVVRNNLGEVVADLHLDLSKIPFEKFEMRVDDLTELM